MSKGVDTFELIVHFLNHNLEPSHITIGLFETINKSRAAMATQVNEVLPTYGLNAKNLEYVRYDHYLNLCCFLQGIKVDNTIHRELLGGM
jgi:hypothetical protein